MARPHLKISVPQPCSESWVAMAPQGEGRHCHSCSTTVIDFSQFIDQQLLAYLQQNPGQKCGRFAESQLERPLFLEQTPTMSFFPKLAAAAALLFGISSQTQAQIQMQHPVPTNEVVPEKTRVASKVGEVVTNGGDAKAGESGGLVISGKLIDAETMEPVPFGNVVVKGTPYYSMTDVEGRFKIAIPDSFKVQDFILATSNLGYLKSEIKLKRDSILTDLELKLEVSSGAISTGIMIYQPRKTPRYYAKRLWWSTRTFLGNKEDDYKPEGKNVPARIKFTPPATEN